MENKINWERKDYWNDYHIYDEYFLSFHLDHAGLKESEWKELIEKWKLNTRVIGEDISVYNDDYSIVMTTTFYYMMLTFSKNVDMQVCIRFFKDFMSALDHYEDLIVREGIISEYATHPKEIIETMIDKL
jgi:hypothetical protein